MRYFIELLFLVTMILLNALFMASCDVNESIWKYITWIVLNVLVTFLWIFRFKIQKWL